MKTVVQLLCIKPEYNRNVHTIAPEQMVLEAVRTMAERNVGALLVVEDGVVIGVISQRDYARKMVLKGRSPAGTPVRDKTHFERLSSTGKDDTPQSGRQMLLPRFLVGKSRVIGF